MTGRRQRGTNSRSSRKTPARNTLATGPGRARAPSRKRGPAKVPARPSVETAPRSVAVVGIAPDGTVSRWNRDAEKLFGYRRAEIVGQSINMLLGPDHEEEVRRLERALGGGLSIKGYQTTRLTKSRKRIAIRMTVSAVRREGGPVEEYLANASAVPAGAPAPADSERQDLEGCIVASAAELRADLADRERLARQLLAAQDDERRRLGRELHDSTGQLLVALSMNLARLERRFSDGTPEHAALLGDSRDLLERALREVRTVSYLLHPPMLDEAGLASAMRWYIAGFAQRSGISAALDIADGFPRLAREAETTLFRVLQESVTNVHRHARSDSLAVHLRYARGVATLEVRDRGRGFPVPGASSVHGVGIPGMRERLHRLGGSLAIASGPHGTRVRATVPCAALPDALTPRSEEGST